MLRVLLFSSAKNIDADADALCVAVPRPSNSLSKSAPRPMTAILSGSMSNAQFLFEVNKLK